MFVAIVAIFIQLIAVFNAFYRSSGRTTARTSLAVETTQETIRKLISKAVENSSNKPTEECQETALSVIIELCNNYGILPHRAAVTGEATILVFFRCVDSNFQIHTLDFEFYGDDVDDDDVDDDVDDDDVDDDNTVIVVLSNGSDIRCAARSSNDNHFNELIEEFSQYL
jgi:hypothetical protein